MDLSNASELCAAVKAGDADRAKRAIEAGDSIAMGRINGVEKPPLVWASFAASADCMRALLAAGADVDARGGSGETALMWAVAKGSRDCMEVLLGAGADVNARDYFGMTPAMWAARFGLRGGASLIEALAEAGADLRLTDSMRRTAATHAKIGRSPEMSSLIKTRIAALDESKRLAKAIKGNSPKGLSQALRM